MSHLLVRAEEDAVSDVLLVACQSLLGDSDSDSIAITARAASSPFYTVDGTMVLCTPERVGGWEGGREGGNCKRD